MRLKSQRGTQRPAFVSLPASKTGRLCLALIAKEKVCASDGCYCWVDLPALVWSSKI